MPNPKLEDIDPNDLHTLGKGLIRSFTITQAIEPHEIEVPPSLDPSLADYVIAIDDSGRNDSILDRNGNFRVSKQPITVLGAFGIPINSLDAFNADWNELRLQIKKELVLDHLPPIHMRIMYGKKPTAVYKQRPNPYVGRDFDRILNWITYAQYLLSHYSYDKEHHIDQTYQGYPEAFHSSFAKIMTKTKLWKDLRYLRRTKRKAYEFAVTRLSHPLPKLIALTLGIINETLKVMGNKTAVLLFALSIHRGACHNSRYTKSLQS